MVINFIICSFLQTPANATMELETFLVPNGNRNTVSVYSSNIMQYIFKINNSSDNVTC